MTRADQDIRFGHDLEQIQDEAGVDLSLLKQQLKLSVEERFLNLEKQLEFLRELQGAAKR